MAPEQVEVGDGRLEVWQDGDGEPVLFIQTALTADELVPTARAPALGGHRRIVFHRRGYGDSSPAHDPASIGAEARDCLDLLRALQVPPVHVVGLSWAGAVALPLARDAPLAVRTLTLVEPPPTIGVARDDFRATSDELARLRHERGPEVALDRLMTLLDGSDWRVVLERRLPGSVAQMVRDATTFFDVDMPALLAWRFTAADAARVTCPVLHVGGTDSGPWFAAVRDRVLAWFPAAEDVTIDGADHSLALTHPDAVARAIAAFSTRHPLAG